MIHHVPMFDVEKVEKIYSEKDGVPVKYVCTSAITEGGNQAVDVFYRDTPHPEFGNRYFGLYVETYTGTTYITNADRIEDLTFVMIYDKVDEQWHYSQHRHDYHSINEQCAIDGGRAYTRIVGTAECKSFKIQNGEFVDA
jgi:hypothetical protein